MQNNEFGLPPAGLVRSTTQGVNKKYTHTHEKSNTNEYEHQHKYEEYHEHYDGTEYEYDNLRYIYLNKISKNYTLDMYTHTQTHTRVLYTSRYMHVCKYAICG